MAEPEFLEIRRRKLEALEASGVDAFPNGYEVDAALGVLGARYADHDAEQLDAAAEAMRRILVESARRRLAKKRGGGVGVVSLEDDEVSIEGVLSDERLLEVHEVLDRLAEINEMDARVVKLRYFGGMKLTEIAALHSTSKRTVQRHLLAAKAWLYENLNGG